MYNMLGLRNYFRMRDYSRYIKQYNCDIRRQLYNRNQSIDLYYRQLLISQRNKIKNKCNY